MGMRWHAMRLYYYYFPMRFAASSQLWWEKTNKDEHKLEAKVTFVPIECADSHNVNNFTLATLFPYSQSLARILGCSKCISWRMCAVRSFHDRQHRTHDWVWCLKSFWKSCRQRSPRIAVLCTCVKNRTASTRCSRNFNRKTVWCAELDGNDLLAMPNTIIKYVDHFRCSSRLVLVRVGRRLSAVAFTLNSNV